MKKYVNTASRYLTAVFIFLIAFSFSSDPPNGRTGAPGDGVCSSCHSGNNFTGNISIDGLPEMAISGETYTIGVTVKNTDAMAVRAGFQMVSLFNNGEFPNAGDFTADSSDEGVSVAGGRTYIEHRGAKNFQDSIAAWIFEWEAPIVDTDMEVVMFAAGNITNGNSSSSGDAIKFTDQAIMVQAAGLAPIEVSISGDVILCNGESTNLEVSATGGTGTYSYLWSNGNTTVTNLNVQAGSYSVTVTDTNDSLGVAEINLTQLDAIIIELSSVAESAQGAMDGVASSEVSGGTAPYTFLWSNDSIGSSISGLEAGTYQLVITDANGCTGAEQIEVITTDDCLFSINLGVNNITCAGAADGDAIIDPADFVQPLSFEWSNGDNSFIAIAGLSPGDYAVTVSDGSGCSKVEEFTITDPAPLEITLVSNFPDCENTMNNSLDAVVAGGTGNYSYVWNNGNTTGSLADLAEGTYSVTVVDENACTNSAEVDFVFGDNISPTITFVDSIRLFVDSSGMIDTSPLGIETSDNCSTVETSLEGDMTCTDIGPRTWTIIAKDESGNITNEEVYIAGIIDTIAPIVMCLENISRDGCDTIFYDLPLVLDNCGIDRMELSEGLPSGSVFPKESTKVTYNYYDAAGNFACCSFWVVTTNDLTLVIDDVADATAGEGGSIGITSGGGSGTYTFEWTLNDTLVVSNFEDVSGLEPGSYKVKVTDENGCIILSKAILIELGSGIFDEHVVELKISPNPVSNLLSLSASEKLGKVRIYNINGQFVSESSEVGSSNMMNLNVEDLQIGLYFLQVELEVGTRILKFVKQ